jgi:hypothetical protein
LRLFPAEFDRLIEPFAGSAALTIASAYYFKANRFVINDINEPLIQLWDAMINNPKSIIKYYHDILSYDGRTGDKTFGQPLPENLDLIKIEINAGRSSQATLNNRKEYTFEAIYLSSSLVEKIDLQKVTGKQISCF